MSFFQEFKTDIFAIGNEFKDRFLDIPKRASVVADQLPTALTGFIVVLVMLALIAVAILIFSKIMAKVAIKNEKAEEAKQEAPAPAAAPAAAPLADGNSAGKLDLVDVDEATAAVIMAIVSEQSGIPLNRLSFKSIKKVED